MKRLLIVAFCLLAWIPRAEAQVCGGGASFAKNPYQINASLGGLTSDATVTSVGAGIGTDPWWVQASVQLTSVSGADGHSTGFGALLGGDYAADDEKKLYVCPLLGFTHSSRSVNNVDFSSTQYGIGGNAGYIATQLGSATVIPTVGLGLHHQSFSSSISGVNGSASTSQNYLSLQVGVGFVFTDKLALVPSVVIPIGFDGGETSILLAASYNFGK